MLGLPFDLSRAVVLPALFGVSFVYMVISELISLWTEMRRPLEEGYRRCPRCRAIILSLALTCPKCKKEI